MSSSRSSKRNQNRFCLTYSSPRSTSGALVEFSSFVWLLCSWCALSWASNPNTNGGSLRYVLCHVHLLCLISNQNIHRNVTTNWTFDVSMCSWQSTNRCSKCPCSVKPYQTTPQHLRENVQVPPHWVPIPQPPKWERRTKSARSWLNLNKRMNNYNHYIISSLFNRWCSVIGQGT